MDIFQILSFFKYIKKQKLLIFLPPITVALIFISVNYNKFNEKKYIYQTTLNFNLYNIHYSHLNNLFNMMEAYQPMNPDFMKTKYLSSSICIFLYNHRTHHKVLDHYSSYKL